MRTPLNLSICIYCQFVFFPASCEFPLASFCGFCVHLGCSFPSMSRGFVMYHEPLPFAVGQEKLPPEACLSCQQGRAKGPVIGSPDKMNLTNCKSN